MAPWSSPAASLCRKTSSRIRVAVPGTLTTAYLALKIFNPAIETVTVPFDRIIPEILAGTYDAGLIIHEGQLTYSTSGLFKVIDLGVWWRDTTGLVLPLGGNAIRRSLGAKAHKIISKALRDSIRHAQEHREQALEYAMQFARDLDLAMASHFVSMYVNERTLDYGADGREAIRKLLDSGPRARHHPHRLASRLRGLTELPNRRLGGRHAEPNRSFCPRGDTVPSVPRLRPKVICADQ